MKPLALVQDLRMGGRPKRLIREAELECFTRPSACLYVGAQASEKYITFFYSADGFRLLWRLDRSTGFVALEAASVTDEKESIAIPLKVFRWFLYTRLSAESEFASDNEDVAVAAAWNRMMDEANYALESM